MATSVPGTARAVRAGPGVGTSSSARPSAKRNRVPPSGSVGDVGIVPRTAFAAVGAPGRDQERLPAWAGRCVAIGMAPRILGQPRNIMARDQHLQPLLRRRIALVVEPVH